MGRKNQKKIESGPMTMIDPFWQPDPDQLTELTNRYWPANSSQRTTKDTIRWTRRISSAYVTDIGALLSGIAIAFSEERAPRWRWIKARSGLRSFTRWYLNQLAANEQQAKKSLKSYAKWSEWYAAGNPKSVPPKIVGGSRGVTERRGKQTLNFPFLSGPTDVSRLIERFWKKDEISKKEIVLLFQLARFARGMAPASEDICVTAIREWYENATTFHCREKDRFTVSSAMEEYSKRWAKRYTAKQRTVHTSFSTSASLFDSRKEKGKAAAIVEGVKCWLNRRLESFQVPEPGVYYTVLGTRHVLHGPGEDDDESRPYIGSVIAQTRNAEETFCVQELVLLWALSFAPYNFAWEVSTDRNPDVHHEFNGILPDLWKDSPPEVYSAKCDVAVTARVCAVREDGNKARIVTTDPDVVTVLLHTARDVLYSAIERDPYMTAHDHGTIWHFGRKIERRKRPIKQILSVDKTTFSDTFDLPLQAAIYDGVTSGHNDPNAQRILRALRPFAVGPRRYLVPDFHRGITSISTKAAKQWFYTGDQNDFFVLTPGKNKAVAPMGSPITYSINCLWSRFEHDASADFRGIGPFLAEPRFSTHVAVTIQGDDTTCECSGRKSKRYEAICKITGTKIGDGAHHLSRRLAVFCEECLVKVNSNWEHHDTIKTRVLVATNCKKDPRLPTGVIDPLLTRGTAVSSQIRYATENQKRASIYVLGKTIRRKTGEFRHLYTPSFLGGLGYPSRRSDKRIWRKWVPKDVKKIISAVVSPDATEQTVTNPNTLNSVGYFNKKGLVNRADLLSLLDRVPRPRDSKAWVEKNPLRITDEDVPKIGMIHVNELIRKFSETHGLKRDEAGNEPHDLKYRGRRWMLRQIPRESDFEPLSDTLRTLGTDDSLRSMLTSLKSARPYFGYGTYKKARKERIEMAREALGERAVGTPIIRNPPDFQTLQTRLYTMFGQIWINRKHPETELLLSRAGLIKVGIQKDPNLNRQSQQTSLPTS